MKQGEKFIKFLMVLLAAAVLAYFGYAAYGYFSEPVTTVTALEYEADVGAAVTGFVVREELPLLSDAAITVPTRAEGEHVGKGQTVAVTYGSDDARQRQAEIENLTAQIEMLACAADDSIPEELLGETLAAQLTEFAKRTALGQSTAEDDRSLQLKGLAVRSGADADALAAIEAELAVLQTERDRLIRSGESGGTVLTASQAGYFSGSADGYETLLTPEMLAGMTAQDFRALMAQHIEPGDTAYGRLICSDRWYFVTEVEAALLESLGDAATLSFPRNALPAIPMEIVRAEETGDGTALLVLAGNSYVREVTLLRQQSGTLRVGSYSGLRVPKDAVRIGAEGEAGVFVLEGAVASWKPVEILYDTGANYVAALDTSSTDHLWPGDEILLGSGLYDGKVVYK